ncbi:MAG: exodeoxyribonuclease VII large subunit [Verrucomicrobia subdivision 3 bacterium]|nr:exodeoxyribonuclease VII large subunit [Limisphaerales bacterium]
MAKDSQSQWDFGELFAEKETRDVFTVSELTTRVKRALENQIGQVWVEGEISNLRAQASGHMYFSIKDVRTQLTCVLFRGTRVDQRELMEDGQKVVLQGDLTVYEQRGQYQLIVRAVEMQGVGALQAKFEKLKAKLQSEGLFDAESKQELPSFPQRIGIVSSLSAAALRDVLHVVRRRQPSLQIVLAASRVQGKGAENEIAEAIGQLNRWAETEPLDLILITRGGGSLEDLWAFNEESLARAIHASIVPVVSAVGHEIDFTISDFVADARAATPSAAAEIITTAAVALQDSLATTGNRLTWLVRRRRDSFKEHIAVIAHRLGRCHPRRRLQERMQRVDELHTDLQRAAQSRRQICSTHWRSLAERLLRVHPKWVVRHRRQQAAQLAARLRERKGHHLDRAAQRLTRLVDRLRLLGPANVLARGYSITLDVHTQKVIRSVKQAPAGTCVRTQLRDGSIESTVG